MRARQIALVIVAAACGGLFVASGSATRELALNDPVRITNAGCALDYHSTSRSHTEIVFGVSNIGTVLHGFDISGRYKTGLIRPGQEATLVTQLGPGSYKWACVSAHSTVKRGVFTIH
jgi:hypothetical protein